MGATRLNLLFATLTFICFGIATCSVSDLPSHGEVRKPLDPGFDLFLLVRTWSPTFCEQLKEMREECTTAPLQEFTIHGLWPEYTTGGWPQFCDKDADKSSSAAVGSVILGREEVDEDEKKKEGDSDDDDNGKARCEWPSFHGSTSTFWDHEWSRHGTCAAPLLGNRTEFFKTVVQLHDKYDLNHLFQSKGLWPRGNSQGSYYSVDALTIVKDAWGVYPRLACHKGSLSELWLCVDLDLNLMECPPKAHPGEMCSTEFRLPPGQPVS